MICHFCFTVVSLYLMSVIFLLLQDYIQICKIFTFHGNLCTLNIEYIIWERNVSADYFEKKEAIEKNVNLFKIALLGKAEAK